MFGRAAATPTKKGNRKSGTHSVTNTSQPLPFLFIPADVDKEPVSLMKVAAKQSLDTGIYVDTKFYLFSKRKRPGVVCAPRAVFSNSWLLRARLPTYFEPLLRGGYEGSSIVGQLDAEFPKEFTEETADYDYDEDSDLEDDDETQDTEPAFSSVEKAEDSEPKVSTQSSDTEVEDTKPTSAAALGLCPNGRTIMMKNHAHATWKAFIFYLYTGDILFAPLKSQRKMGPSADAVQRRDLMSSPPPCSPKSMYRLADELGFEELKQKAEADIRDKLSEVNIMEELFSTLPCRYDSIRDMEITYACSYVRGVISSQFHTFLSSMDADDLSRYSDIISHLVARLAS